MDKELLKKYSEGLIATSACMKGEVNWHLLKGDSEAAATAADELNDIFGQGNFFLEIQNHGLEKELFLLPMINTISKETGIPMVATNDCHYLKQEDSEAHDALLCIQTGKLVSDTDRMKYNTDQIYFKSPDEMTKTFGDFPEAVQNTIRIAEECHLELELGKLYLPQFTIPTDFVNADDFLQDLCLRGLNERYTNITDDLKKRLEYELSVIKQMKYAGYFLIVKDFIDYARSQNIPVGPGRGSAAGSLVSYCLKITNIDPIKYSLLFERFLNPERISMPDIDIDFADRDRDKIINYVVEKYGKDNVCQIITFGTMAARAVVRDVGRVLGMPYAEVDKIAKMVPFAVKITLDQALTQSAELKELYDRDNDVRKLIDLSKTLEGLTRHASTHAAGVVIAPAALTEYVPLFKGTRDEITTQFDMKIVEQIGLLKMDFLGLRTLTVIDDTLKMIEENTGEKIDIDKVALNDKKVYKQFTRGDTVAIFQFESGGMRDYLRRLKPENLTDLTSMNALYRPGPLDSGMIDTYIDRKRGVQEINFEHPRLEKILKDTYGVIVFQEQVLQIANSLAGYSMGKADILRKAMGKKQAELMAEQKREFLNGCEKKGIDAKIAQNVFDQIETFARYGFNKAHSTGYAYIAYQCGYLKAYYPNEFMAANMSSEMDSSDRIYTLMEECRRMNITVLPPDVNISEKSFMVRDKKIRFGLLAVKNIGEGVVEAILAARNDSGEFESFADFVSRTNPKHLNRRALESLINAGALDSISGGRAQKAAVLENMLEFGQKVYASENTADLFAANGGKIERKEPEMPDIPEWPVSRSLSLEKEYLGVYVTGHPLDRFRMELKSFDNINSEQIKLIRDGREILFGGIISSMKLMNDKRGNRMAFATLEDFTGSVEAIIFSSCYEKIANFVAVDKLIMARGRVSTREGENPKLIVSDLFPLETISERFDCQLVLNIEMETTDKKLEAIIKTLEKNQGNTKVIIAAKRNGQEILIESSLFAVKPGNKMISRLKELLGDSAVYLKRASR
jgi:DNA polymerase-3 subunit alpha